MKRRLPAAASALFAATGLLLGACGIVGGDPDATPTPAPSATATPAPATPTPFPTFTATPQIGVGTAIVVGGDLRVRSAPNTQSAELETLKDRQQVVLAEAVRGENWLVGSQTWVPTVPDWTTTWFRLEDGSYVYAGFVFILQPGEESPLSDPHGQEKWIDVDVSRQTATAMIGDRPVYEAAVSTGSAEFPSPLGRHTVERQVAVERMTATQAGYTPQQATYDVERVLFTQYYDLNGNALHLNYWRPASVFGRAPTSHGCVGMQLHDAQYFWLFADEGTRVEVHG
jgi:lipoprotein-anchoring transpeptidase ErfK/SrfK